MATHVPNALRLLGLEEQDFTESHLLWDSSHGTLHYLGNCAGRYDSQVGPARYNTPQAYWRICSAHACQSRWMSTSPEARALDALISAATTAATICRHNLTDPAHSLALLGEPCHRPDGWVTCTDPLRIIQAVSLTRNCRAELHRLDRTPIPVLLTDAVTQVRISLANRYQAEQAILRQPSTRRDLALRWNARIERIFPGTPQQVVEHFQARPDTLFPASSSKESASFFDPLVEATIMAYSVWSDGYNQSVLHAPQLVKSFFTEATSKAINNAANPQTGEDVQQLAELAGSLYADGSGISFPAAVEAARLIAGAS